MSYKHLNITLLFSLSLIIIACGNKKSSNNKIVNTNSSTAIITGEIAGFSKNSPIAITEINFNIDDETVNTIATTQIKNGKFNFEGITIDTPRAVKLTFEDSINTVIFLEPGDININISLKDTIFTEMFSGIELRAKRTGSVNNELFTEYRDKRHAILTNPEYIDLRALDKTMFDLYADFELLNTQLKQFRAKSDKRDPLLYNLKKDFILKHNNKMVSPYIVLFEDYRFDDAFEPSEIIAFFDNYSESLDGNIYYNVLKDYVSNSRNTAIGITLKDFSLKNRNGEDVSLSSFKGKYLLLDFWAYWCKPCVASFPHLEKLRKKYKNDKFEILGISSDPNHEKWIKALDQHTPSWIQVIDTKDKKVSTQFNIAKLPTTFLVDAEGKVMAIDLYAEDLDAELEAIFGH